MEMVAILDFMPLAKVPVYITFKPLVQMQWNVAHTEDV